MRRCCGRYCLYNSLRVVNVVVNIFGLVIIIYSLWLLKKWIDGVAQLPSPSLLPRPWFINVCLGVGIVVCLITLSGHMVANCISKSILGVHNSNVIAMDRSYVQCSEPMAVIAHCTAAQYIVCVFCLLLIQAAAIVAILFRIDWDSQISRNIDDYHKAFKRFLLFHVVICRLIAVLVLVAQIKILVLAAILWAVGGELTVESNVADPIDIRHSFLADYNSPVIGARGWREEILKYYVEGIFTKSFRRLRRNQS